MECIYRFLMYTHNNYILTYIRRIINEYSEYIFAIFLTVYEAVKCRYIYILYIYQGRGSRVRGRREAADPYRERPFSYAPSAAML